MLFYGPPGTGKTSTILALARQLFGCAFTILPLFTISTLLRPDNFRARVLELNASDERGISIVREKIKNFARQTPRAESIASDGKRYPCPPYKIIILDEADSMTQDAQAALRRIMENYARITRFCLVCNYVTRYVRRLKSIYYITPTDWLGSLNPLPLGAQSFASSLSTHHQQDNVSSILPPPNRSP
jgi:replication factor C subunit 2/4